MRLLTAKLWKTGVTTVPCKSNLASGKSETSWPRYSYTQFSYEKKGKITGDFSSEAIKSPTIGAPSSVKLLTIYPVGAWGYSCGAYYIVTPMSPFTAKQGY